MCSVGSHWISALCLNVPPEGIDTGVPLVWDLLEGLVGLPRHDVEARIGIPAATDRPKRGGKMMSNSPDRTSVGAAISERRSGRVVRNAHINLRLKGLDGLLVGERQRLLDDLGHRTVRVCARGV
jgi:hypothetical protein